MEIERDRLQTEDCWEAVIGETEVAFWILHEEDLDQWWSMWSEDGVYDPYYIRWHQKPEREQVVQAYLYRKKEEDGSAELMHMLYGLFG